MEELTSETDIQSIAPNWAEIETKLAGHIESLPNRFVEEYQEIYEAKMECGRGRISKFVRRNS